MVKEILEYTIKKIVEAPEQVSIAQTTKDATLVFEVTVAAHDIGKVIGKEGQTIRALRMYLNAVAPEGKSVDITIAK